MFQGNECQWRILATHGEKIILNVTSLDIPLSQGCQSNYLEIRDGYWHRSTLLARVCGDTVPPELSPIVSSGSRMLLVYRTEEHALPHRGFTASYEGKVTKKYFCLK